MILVRHSSGITRAIGETELAGHGAPEWEVVGDLPDGMHPDCAGAAGNEVVSDFAAAWAAVRAERDARLSACDWTQNADVPLSDSKMSEWRAYRQALRDVPENTADPRNPSWPEPPAS